MKRQKRNNIITYLIFMVGTLVLGFLSSFFVRAGMEEYGSLQKPPLTPPSIVFPIVWSILYLLMSWSAAYVYINSTDKMRVASLKIYIIQLVCNLLWSLFFFTLGWYFFSFLWLLLLLVLVLSMIIIFHETSKLASLLQIPYIVWLVIAGYLNLFIFTLNR